MKSNEKEMFMEDLKAPKASNEYFSNISRCVQVEQHKIFGLKSYDCHLLNAGGVTQSNERLFAWQSEFCYSCSLSFLQRTMW